MCVCCVLFVFCVISGMLIATTNRLAKNPSWGRAGAINLVGQKGFCQRSVFLNQSLRLLFDRHLDMNWACGSSMRIAFQRSFAHVPPRSL